MAMFEDPMREFTRLRRSMDRLFRDFERGMGVEPVGMEVDPLMHPHAWGLPLWSALTAPMTDVSQPQQITAGGDTSASGTAAGGGQSITAAGQQGTQQQQLARPFSRALAFSPHLDISETEKSYVLRADLPGVPRENIKISVKDNVLCLSGERKEEKRQESETVRRVERRYGSFSRSLQLPPTVDTDNINANYENGVLCLTLPKKENAQVNKDIKIN